MRSFIDTNLTRREICCQIVTQLLDINRHNNYHFRLRLQIIALFIFTTKKKHNHNSLSLNVLYLINLDLLLVQLATKHWSVAAGAASRRTQPRNTRHSEQNRRLANYHLRLFYTCLPYKKC